MLLTWNTIPGCWLEQKCHLRGREDQCGQSSLLEFLTSHYSRPPCTWEPVNLHTDEGGGKGRNPKCRTTGRKKSESIGLFNDFFHVLFVGLFVLFLSLAPFGGIKLSSSQENLSFRDMISSVWEKSQLLPLLLHTWAIYSRVHPILWRYRNPDEFLIEARTGADRYSG